jgi:hypothetical protein
MDSNDSYPIEQKGVAIAVRLIVVYVVLVANALLFYLLVAEDKKLPLNYFLLMSVAGVSAWALHRRWLGGLWLLTVFFGWQLYVGFGGAFGYFNAAVKNNSIEAVTFIVLWMARTIVILILFAVLVFHALRKQTVSE